MRVCSFLVEGHEEGVDDDAQRDEQVRKRIKYDKRQNFGQSVQKKHHYSFFEKTTPKKTWNAGKTLDQEWISKTLLKTQIK